MNQLSVALAMYAALAYDGVPTATKRYSKSGYRNKYVENGSWAGDGIKPVELTRQQKRTLARKENKHKPQGQEIDNG